MARRGLAGTPHSDPAERRFYGRENFTVSRAGQIVADRPYKRKRCRRAFGCAPIKLANDPPAGLTISTRKVARWGLPETPHCDPAFRRSYGRETITVSRAAKIVANSPWKGKGRR